MRLLGRAVLCALVFGALLTLLVPVALGGATDSYYQKVATPKQRALILGTSRAAQGIVPQVLDGMSGSWRGPILNFAFTMKHSPYGQTYLHAIQAKLDPEGRDGLFILEVSPFALSRSRQGDDVEAPEAQSFLGRLHAFDIVPNPEYVFHADRPGFSIVDSVASRLVGGYYATLNRDGWLNVHVPKRKLHDKKRFRSKIASYEKMAREQEDAPARWQALRETIALLKPHGEVVLVRLPMGRAIYEIERAYMPAFDQRQQALADEMGTPYLSLADDSGRYATTDGNHLFRDAAKQVTRRIGLYIQGLQTPAGRHSGQR